MAQEVKVLTWCDPCLSQEEPEHTEGQPFAVEFSIGGSRPVRIEVDLCDRHGKDVTDVTEWLTTVGRRSKGTAAKAVPLAVQDVLPGVEAQAGPLFECPAGCGRADLAKRTGLIQHLKRTHGLELEEAQRLADQAVPAA